MLNFRYLIANARHPMQRYCFRYSAFYATGYLGKTLLTSVVIRQSTNGSGVGHVMTPLGVSGGKLSKDMQTKRSVAIPNGSNTYFLIALSSKIMV